MRAPRDYALQIEGLRKKEKALQAKRVEQLGQLVLATGADAQSLDVIAGLLLSLKELNQEARENYALLGAEFFSRGRGKARGEAAADRPSLKAVEPDAA